MPRTRIKICGITREDDARRAAQLGADAVGLVFYERSPRYVTPEQAVRIASALPPLVTTVGLFVDADEHYIQSTIQQVPLDCLQFHGEESPEACARFGRPWYKAIRMHPEVDLNAEAQRFSAARGLLVDTWMAGLPGGTGATFDWQRIPSDLALPVILAGGLTPDNVGGAVAATHPWAVDVSGGVEERDAQGHPLRGCKSADAMADFIRGVQGD